MREKIRLSLVVDNSAVAEVLVSDIFRLSGFNGRKTAQILATHLGYLEPEGDQATRYSFFLLTPYTVNEYSPILQAGYRPECNTDGFRAELISQIERFIGLGEDDQNQYAKAVSNGQKLSSKSFPPSRTGF